MKILKNIVVSLKDPEQNGCDASTKFSTHNPNTYAILNENGECIEAKYNGLICLPLVVMHDSLKIVIEIQPSIPFLVKLKLKEYVAQIS